MSKHRKKKNIPVLYRHMSDDGCSGYRIFLLDKETRRYKVVGTAGTVWYFDDNLRNGAISFKSCEGIPDADWIRATRQDLAKVTCWMPRKYWHVKA